MLKDPTNNQGLKAQLYRTERPKKKIVIDAESAPSPPNIKSFQIKVHYNFSIYFANQLTKWSQIKNQWTYFQDTLNLSFKTQLGDLGRKNQ